MTINGSIDLRGFERKDRGDDGLIFLRYREAQMNEQNDEKKAERKAEIYKSPMYYHGPDTEHYTLTIPKPPERKFDACAVLVRTSKNKYTVTAFDDVHIIMFKSESLDDVQKRCNEFFKL